MLPPPDSTRLKPLLLLTVSGPLLMLLLLTQLDSRAMRQQAERATIRRLRAIVQTIEADLTMQSGESDSLPASASRLKPLADSLFVRLQILKLGEQPRLLFDSQSGSSSGQQSERSSRITEDASTPAVIDWNARELFLARTSGSGDDQRRINGVWHTFVAIQLPQTGEKNLALRISAPTYSSSGSSNFGLMFAWFAGVVLAGLLASAAVLIYRRSQVSLDRLSATHRNIRRLTERDETLPGADARLPELVDAYAETSRRLESLISGNRSRIRELEQATAFLETVLEAMVEGVVVVDRQHRIAFANHAAAALLRIESTTAGIAGRPMLEIIRNPVVDQTLKRIDAGHDRIQTEFTLRGEQRILSLFATRLRGNVSGGAMLVLQDVTDLRRLENLRKDFVSNVSHELKTPLAGIQAYAETLLGGAIDDADACHRFVTRIQEQSDRLHDLVQDLLQLGRIEAGQEAFKLERVSIAESILTSVESQQPVAAGKNISIELQSTSADLFVKADRKGLQTVFDNLISNAVKYTPEAGRVQINWSQSDGQVQIDVIDSGVGIPSEHLPRIFERFYRVDEARSRDVGGTGLGLSIVKHLINEFGGSVDVQSEPGKGSTFTVRLPAA
ncbi:PAS domain-containing protein [bacterium]|nr:PAS domain-containing protein [bacterium]